MQMFCLNILFDHQEKNVEKKLSIRIHSLNVKFQATYTTKLEFRTMYYVKKKV